jgi:hypothetical protein
LAEAVEAITVLVPGGARLHQLDRHPPALAGGLLQADRAEELLRRQPKAAPLLQHLGGALVHALVEARDGYPAIGVMQVGDDPGEHVDRVARRAAEEAGMQVAIGAGDLHLEIGEAAQAGGDGRGGTVPHGGVADQHHVAAEFFAVGRDPFGKPLRAALLGALDEDGDAAGQLAAHGDVGAAGLHEGHHLALVVGGAAPDDLFPTFPVLGDVRLEGGRLPQVEGIDRLHVVMAVEQDVRRPGLRPVGQHHRVE